MLFVLIRQYMPEFFFFFSFFYRSILSLKADIVPNQQESALHDWYKVTLKYS